MRLKNTKNRLEKSEIGVPEIGGESTTVATVCCHVLRYEEGAREVGEVDCTQRTTCSRTRSGDRSSKGKGGFSTVGLDVGVDKLE